MKIFSKDPITAQEIVNILETGLPQYKVELLKNPLFRFEYVQVRKTAFVGLWVRPHKDNSITIDGAVPSTMARAFLGGGLLLLITYFRTKDMKNEVSNLLQDKLK